MVGRVPSVRNFPLLLLFALISLLSLALFLSCEPRSRIYDDRLVAVNEPFRRRQRAGVSKYSRQASSDYR